MSAKKGTFLPVSGTLLPDGLQHFANGLDYAEIVAAALRRQLGKSPGAIKTVMRWTGASERAVKNWLSGAKGPSGAHLIALAAKCDAVWEACLQMTGRGQPVAAEQLVEARTRLEAALRCLEGPGGYRS